MLKPASLLSVLCLLLFGHDAIVASYRVVYPPMPNTTMQLDFGTLKTYPFPLLDMPRTLKLGFAAPFDGAFFLVRLITADLPTVITPVLVRDHDNRIRNVSKVLYLISSFNTTTPSHTFDSVVIHSWKLLQAAGAQVDGLACQTAVDSYPGQESVFEDDSIPQSERDAVGVPVFETNWVDWSALTQEWVKNTSAPLVIWVGADETNYHLMWTQAPGLTFIVIVAIFNSTALGFCVMSIVGFARAGRCRISVPIVCLAFHFFASLTRMIWNVVRHPQQTGQINASLFVGLSMQLSLPFLICATLLIVLYWNELIAAKTAKPLVFLDRFRIPYLIIVFISFALSLSMSIAALLYTFFTFYIYFFIVFIQIITISIIVWVYGFRVRAMLLATPGAGKSAKVARLLWATNKMMLSAAALTLLLPAIVLQGYYAFDPLTHMIGSYWVCLLFSAVTVLQISTFQPRAKEIYSTASTK